MRMTIGGVVELQPAIGKDLAERLLSQVDIRSVSNLAECAAYALVVKRTINNMLANPLIDWRKSCLITHWSQNSLDGENV
jgi:hypothetical protein